jgi:hypothetical protein
VRTSTIIRDSRNVFEARYANSAREIETAQQKYIKPTQSTSESARQNKRDNNLL